MSVMNALYAGVSGMLAEGEALGIVGDNVANANTVGFKQSRAVFQDVLGGAMGAGVRISRAQQIFAQGTMFNTGQPTDLALSGDGFFVVSGNVDGATGNYYTRAGQTTLSESGQLVNADGMSVQGYVADGKGGFGSSLGPIQVSTASLQPKATGGIKLTANFDANAPVAAAWDPANPEGTSNFSTSTRVFDSLGKAHNVDVFFRKTAAGAWEYKVMGNGAELAGNPPGKVELGTGTLTFTNSGALQATAGAVQADFDGAAPAQAISFDFGKTIANGGSGLDGSTQFGAPSNVSAQSQDGYSSGDLSGIRIDGEGVVSGVYSNGEQIAVGKLAVAKFRSNDGLARAGKNLWQATRESGEAALGAAGAGGRAGITAGALEQSNVDIATQFVDLITHQRAFQANSRSITTANEMLEEIVNLKR
jgi:flagellar hook protein FlgE